MLRNTKDMAIAGESDIKSNTLWAARFRVGVAAKRFFPPSALVFSGVSFFPLNFRAPMFQIQKTLMVDLHMCLTISLEFHLEGRVADDRLKLIARSV